MSFPFETRDNTSRIPDMLDNDPEDFSWIKSWASIGESFAAGIGADNVLSGPGDVACSRYDGAAAQLINAAIGGGHRKYNSSRVRE